MKLYMLTYAERYPEFTTATIKATELLIDAAKKRGHDLQVIYARECKMKFGKKPTILVNDKPLRGVKAIFVKSSFRGKQLFTHGNLIKQFELMGVRTINTFSSTVKTKDKVAMLQALSQGGVPIPKTTIVHSADYIVEEATEMGSFPIILKSVSGAQGIGVSIVESKRGLRSIAEMLLEDGDASPLIVQEYVKESSGKDIRIFIIGGKIVAAMERIAKRRGEFRSNFSMGGRVRLAELSEKEKSLARKAARVYGIDVAGVDLIRTKNGPKILEVNSNPGLLGITQATGIDVAGKLIDYLVQETISATHK